MLEKMVSWMFGKYGVYEESTDEIELQESNVSYCQIWKLFKYSI